MQRPQSTRNRKSQKFKWNKDIENQFIKGRNYAKMKLIRHIKSNSFNNVAL